VRATNSYIGARLARKKSLARGHQSLADLLHLVLSGDSRSAEDQLQGMSLPSSAYLAQPDRHQHFALYALRRIIIAGGNGWNAASRWW